MVTEVGKRDGFAEGEGASSSRRELAASVSSPSLWGWGRAGPPPSAFCSPAAASCFVQVQGLAGGSEHLGWVLGARHEMQWGSRGDTCTSQPLFSATKTCYQGGVTRCRSLEHPWKLQLGAPGNSSGCSLPESRCVTHPPTPYTTTVAFLFLPLTTLSVGVMRWHPHSAGSLQKVPLCLGKFIQQTKDQFSSVVSSHPVPIPLLLSVKHLQEQLVLQRS